MVSMKFRNNRDQMQTILQFYMYLHYTPWLHESASIIQPVIQVLHVLHDHVGLHRHHPFLSKVKVTLNLLPSTTLHPMGSPWLPALQSRHLQAEGPPSHGRHLSLHSTPVFLPVQEVQGQGGAWVQGLSGQG